MRWRLPRSRAGTNEAAIRWLLRSLATTPNPEACLRLVATAGEARRHGEARRYYAIYVRRMESMGEPAAPFPGRGRLIS